MFCSHCGAEIHDNAIICVKCGCAVNNASVPKPVNPNKSEKSWTAAMLLCLFLGGFGVHRFYVGKVGSGVIQLLTLGCCGIWTLVDFIIIVTGGFTDNEGKLICE
ncbi:MAG: TM2 domain-containing protein [Alistipes sp.]|nr:TM2 domain-containing protein [Alistipes sp.]